MAIKDVTLAWIILISTPLSQFFLQAKKNMTLALRGYIVLLGAIGAVAVAAFFAESPMAEEIAIAYGIGFFAFQWIANAVVVK